VTYPILTTKLFIPSLRADQLSRPRLIEKLNEGAAYPLTLISASAGSGKTTTLTEWIAQNNRPTAWISLDRGDNDPAFFLTYLISALRTIQGNFAEDIFSTMQSAQAESFEETLINLINAMAKITQESTLVLDDFHTITDQRTNELVAFLVENLPPQIHLVIASRMDPPWPLARYRARNRLFEIRGQDLRFGYEEAAEFLKRTMGLDLSVEEVDALEARTEGWIAGLQLAALSMRGSSNVRSFVKAFTGSHIYVAEYLIEEILHQQPKDIQTFLLKTSLLDRLNASLCEAVSGCDDGRTILQNLYRANIFVIPLDHDGEWFRYHHLFADLLQSRLPQALSANAITTLHQRASLWYEQNGFTIEAVNQAFSAEDYERVAELVRRYAYDLIFSGQVKTLRDWLESLPRASFEDHPHLTFYQFWIDVLQSKADLSDQSIREKEALFAALPSTPENDRLRGELMAVVCRAVALSGRTSEGIRLAQEALAYLPPDGLAARARVLSALASAHDLEGRPDQARPYYQESFTDAITAGDHRLAAHILMVKGLIQLHYGHLHEAAKTYQEIIEMAPADSSKVFFPVGQGYIGLGCVYLEWNDLDAAENYLERGMDLCRQGGLDGVFIGKIRMSRLRQAKGDLSGALKEVQVPQQTERVDNFNLITRQIQIVLAEGDVDHAKHLAAPLVEMLDRDPVSVQIPLLFLEMIEVLVARVYFAQGELEKALQLLDRLESSTVPIKRAGRLVEAYLFRALVYQRQNEGKPTPEAIESFEHALVLGEPEGFVLSFLEAGPEVIPLLDTVIQRSGNSVKTKDYARKLLTAFGETGEPGAQLSMGEEVRLFEPLTPREMEVLELLALGDSNRIIADKLVITVRTVKKHTSNIYGKLNVINRTQAVARARELRLLS